MFQNYLKIAVRNLIKHRAYSIINIGGLAVGMAVTILIAMWVWNELTFDKQIKNYKNVARVMLNTVQNGSVVTTSNLPFPLADELRRRYSKDFKHVALSWETADYVLKTDRGKFRKKGRFMQPDGGTILGLEMIYGKEDVLKDPTTILISKSAAAAVFGTSDAVGKIVKIDNEMSAQVGGVYEDISGRSEFKDISFIGPWDMFASTPRRQWIKTIKDDWSVKTFEILVQTSKEHQVESVSERIGSVIRNRVRDNKVEAALNPTIFLYPMEKWHLYSEWENGVNTGGRITYVWMFGSIGLMVLLLACINYVNLMTARSEKRAKEVGVRKAAGSRRSQLIGQFMSESFLIVLLGFILSLVLVEICLPYFNQISGMEITFSGDGAIIRKPVFWLTGLAFCVFTAFLAGYYPALHLSSINAAKILKSNGHTAGRSSFVARQGLIVFQFVISISLIIGTIIVFEQIKYGQSRTPGYDREGLVNVPMGSYRGPLDALKHDLLETGLVQNIALSSSPATDIMSSAPGFSWEGKSPDLQENFAVIAASHDYGKTVGWKLQAGRDFSRLFPSDSSGIILNETAVKYMGFKDPAQVIGKSVRWKSPFGDNTYSVVGVVKDMLMTSPFEPVKQTIYFMTEAPNFLYIKIKPGVSKSDAIAGIKQVFQANIPESEFDYQFSADEYSRKFESEVRIAELARLFAILAILISCLGIFGMSSFIAEQRSKEIGIRKVLGASARTIWQMLARDFIVLVFIGAVISAPITWYILNAWLQKYAFRVEISWTVYVLTISGSLLLTLITVSFRGIKAALMNPVESLKVE